MALDQGIRLSDERIRLLMRRLEETYAEAYKIAIVNNEKAIAKYASLTDEALKDLTPEARHLKREAFKREIQRTKTLSENIAAEIADAGKTSAKIIQGEMNGIYGLNYDFASFDIQKQAGLNLSFSQYDRNQLAALVQEGQSPFTKIAYKNLGKDTTVVRRLQDQFIQGIMNGESQAKLIQRIKSVTEQSTRQAKRVAQTERVRISSQGRNMAISEAIDMGLNMQKQWIARLFNTRELHEETHLEIVDEEEMFSNGLEYPGDPNGSAENVINCHCVLKPMVESVSPALARHREKFGQQSFEQYQEERQANQSSVVETLQIKETEISKLTSHEEGVTIERKTGKVLEHNKGEAHSVDASPELVKDNIFTHNHPSGMCAFSLDDVKSIINMDGHEVRAVTADGRFVSLMRGVAGWNKELPQEMAKAKLGGINVMLKADGIAMRKYGRGKYTQKQVAQEMEGLVNAWLKDNAEKFDYIFLEGKI